MGIPIHPQLAAAARVPPLDLKKWESDFKAAGGKPGLHLHGLAGNGMACGVVGIVIASVLSCVRFQPPPPLPPPAHPPPPPMALDGHQALKALPPPELPPPPPMALDGKEALKALANGGYEALEEVGIKFIKKPLAWQFALYDVKMVFKFSEFGGHEEAYVNAVRCNKNSIPIFVFCWTVSKCWICDHFVRRRASFRRAPKASCFPG